MFQPRPAQADVLAYSGGYLAVSAVPGSGKTVTLAALAAEILARGLPEESAVLVVTFMNSAVDNLAHRIHEHLEARGVQYAHYEVRTLHSLARQIVLEQPGLAGVDTAFPVLDDQVRESLLERATAAYLSDHPEVWEALLQVDSPDARRYWEQRLRDMAAAAIRLAKNRRWRPQEILAQLEAQERRDMLALRIVAEIYARYQAYVEVSGGLDYDDLVWRAVDLLEQYPDLLQRLRRRWPYILEDEAQDSVPLQEELLSLLAGPEGNWVRVGDPNQAITSTFTAAHPRFFRAFLERPDVRTVVMPQTGRSAPRILALANYLVDWTSTHHPLPEVRQRAFLRQHMEPAPPGDPQPNPPDAPRNIVIRLRGYAHREREELPAVARLLERYAERFPEHTLAVLVPTNEVGYRMAEVLSRRGIPYDELLESSAQARGVAGVLATWLAFAANPLDARTLARLFETLSEAASSENSVRRRLALLLRSTSAPEQLLYPQPGSDPLEALPAGRASHADLEALTPFLEIVRQHLPAASLPADQFVLLLASSLFTDPAALATAQQVAAFLRRLTEADPSLRLPELAEELERIARGRRRFVGLTEDDLGFEPKPGRVTVATQHRAKGLEWDLVCLVGIDRYWIPFDLEQSFRGTDPQFGGNPTATVQAQLRAVMGEPDAPTGVEEATREANLETIAERLRLLYVGITRARRYLQITWSRQVEIYGRDQRQDPTPVLRVLARFLERQGKGSYPPPRRPRKRGSQGGTRRE